jgi:hypothetical protein
MPRAWSLFKRIGLKKYEGVTESIQSIGQKRVDMDLPLGLRFSGIVGFSEVDFILGGDELKIKYPGEDTIVVSYGKFLVGESMVRRFYLDASGRIYVLQVVTDSKNIIEELKLFMPFDEIFPSDWGFWLSEKDGYIGLSVFQTKDGAQYFRVWGSDDDGTVVEEGPDGKITRVPPLKFSETLYLDPFGGESDTVNYESMLYGRHVNDTVDEYLIVSAVEEKNGASVQIMVGMELAPTSIKVI